VAIDTTVRPFHNNGKIRLSLNINWMPRITDSGISNFHMIINEASEGGLSGQCLELPGAISQGATEEELILNMREAIELVLESIEEMARSSQAKIKEITVQRRT
jgi:predicted RNase H-like HicB family nuclease